MTVSGPGPFQADRRQLDVDTLVLRCAGELDYESAPTCRHAVWQVTSPRLVLDLREVTFVDSSGLSVLLAAQRRFRDGRLATCVTPGGAAVRLLALGGVEELMRVRYGLDQAVAALAPVAATPPPPTDPETRPT